MLHALHVETPRSNPKENEVWNLEQKIHANLQKIQQQQQQNCEFAKDNNEIIILFYFYYFFSANM